MGRVKLFTANPKPSVFWKRVQKHNLDVSEGSKSKPIAKRSILGFKVTFYQNGLRLIDGLDLSEQEQFDSQILRYAHASILIGESVGDRRTCYVDASKNPVEIILYNMPAATFMKKSMKLVHSGQVDEDFLLNEHIKKTSELKNERNVRLFGR